MQEQVSDHLQYTRDKYRAFRQKLTVDSLAIGTPAFFREAALAMWGLHQEFLPEHEKRLGEGRLQLLWNLMKVGEETEAIPLKGEIDQWADNLGLIGPMVVDLKIAAGYGVDYERVRSEQYYYDTEKLGEMLGEKEEISDPTLSDILRIHAILFANDFTKLGSYILDRIKRKI